MYRSSISNHGVCYYSIRYSAVQGASCFCGDELEHSVSSEMCNMSCPAASATEPTKQIFCGGDGLIDVYTTYGAY